MLASEEEYLNAIISMIGREPSNIEFLPLKLLNNHDFLLRLVTNNPEILSLLSDNIRNNEDIIRVAVRRNGSVLKHCSMLIQNNIDIVIEAVNNRGHALEYASASLKNNRDVVLTAVAQHGDALQFASKLLQDDFEIVKCAVSNKGTSLEYAGSILKNDKDIVLAAVSNDGVALKFASDTLKNNKEVALLAVTGYGNSVALQYVGTKLQLDRDIVYQAVQDYSQVFTHMNSTFYNDLEIVLMGLYYYPKNRLSLNSSLLSNRQVKFLTERSLKEIPETDWPLVKKALLEQPDKFLNPPDVIKELTDGMPNKYAILAQHALDYQISTSVTDFYTLPHLN